MTTLEILKAARKAARILPTLSEIVINNALFEMANALRENKAEILNANALDLENARGAIPDAMLDRLLLTEARIDAMADGILEIRKLPSPLGRILERTERPNGLIIEKKSVALGVIAIIYESRPNVTSDAAALSLKSGSCAVLRCGKEAHKSALAIVKALKKGLISAQVPESAIALIEDTTRESAYELMRARGLVDLLIPRGGRGLIESCVKNAEVPTLETGTGICHVYIDKDANPDMAISVLSNAKTSRVSVCNACEVCLVHKNLAKTILPRIKEALVDARIKEKKTPVKLILDGGACEIIDGTPAKDGDFDTEFLDYVLAIKIVDSAEDAIEHIEAHSTRHSEAIITDNPITAEKFTNGVDSAAVYVNASTRFTDGGEFGLGCEMGISTQKLHARGPLGLSALTTYKYIIRGNGQVR
jgi:glutamate-5-semialdehyde dehydrogenase